MVIFRKPLAAFLVLAAMLLIGVFLLPRIMPDAYTHRQLARALERETGIVLEKAESVRLSLFPRVAIVLRGATLRVPGFREAPSITAECIVAQVNPWRLFQRRLELDRLVIENPSVLFHVNASGRRNWDFGALGTPGARVQLASLAQDIADPSIKAAIATPTLRSRKPRLPNVSVEITGGTMTYHDEERSQHIGIEAFDAILRTGVPEGAAELDGAFRMRGEEVKLHATLRSPISASEPSAPLTAEIGTRALKAGFNGLVSWEDERGLDGQLRLELVSGPALRDWLGGDHPVLAALDRASVSGNLDVGEYEASFMSGRLQAGEVTGDLDLEVGFDGRARFNLRSLYFYGGRASGRATVDIRAPASVVAGSFEMSDVDSLPLFKGMSGFDWISGRSAATLNIAGGGDNLASVLGTLTGEGSLTVTDGAVEGLDIPALIGKAREGEFRKWQRRPGQSTRFDSLTSAFTLDKGIAKSRELALAGPQITATGEGETNIPGQSVDYRLKVKIKAATDEERARAEDGQVDIPLIVRGSWDKPDIYPDLDKVLRDPKALNDTAKAIGKSVEKFTEGKIKSEDFGKAIEQLFGKKKKKHD
jgi:uncharacterized protein involved in outer membrane biogenesis